MDYYFFKKNYRIYMTIQNVSHKFQCFILKKPLLINTLWTSPRSYLSHSPQKYS